MYVKIIQFNYIKKGFSMKKHIQLTSLLLALLMVLPACSKDEGTSGETTPVETQNDITVETEPAPDVRANHLDALPDDLDFGGMAINCLFRGVASMAEGTSGGYWITNDVCGTDNVGDIVSDLVWERNNSVADRLNVDLQWTASEGGSLKNDITVYKNVVMSSDDTFDYFLATGNTSAGQGMNTYMRDISSIPYVNWESPWWWQFANKALSLDGKAMHFVVGDMLLTNLAQTCIMFFNKSMYTDVYGDADEVYEMVLDGTFTIDNLSTLVAGAYQDVNGDGMADENDTYGLLWSENQYEELAGWAMSLNMDLYQRDADGVLTITMNNERTVTSIEKVYALMNENAGSFIGKGTIADQAVLFTEDASLFLAARMISATDASMREMESEYGLIPMPKLDEKQDMYYAGVHESGTVLCVPKSTAETKIEAVGAVLEALCGEAHRTYMDAFLETAMKTKYSRDEMSGQCIDLIMAGLTKNTLDEYNLYFSGLITACIYNPMKSDPSSFASTFQSNITKAETSWAQALEDMKNQ